MAELLHVGALGATAFGTCCVAADRSRASVWQLVSAVAMLAAMLDIAVTGWLAPVWWALLLLVVAMSVVVASRRAARAMAAYDAVGAILMAVLMLVMASRHPDAGSALTQGAGAHVHGAASPAMLTGLLVAAAIGYAACAPLAVAGHTGRRALTLASIGSMAGSVLLMAFALVAP